MKKFILAALVATIATAPAFAAPNWDNNRDNRGRIEQRDNRHDRADRHDRRDRVQYRNWSRGQRFDSRYAQNYRVIVNPQAYRLRQAPRGYRWVQSGNDALLIGITSGIVASVLAGSFR